MFPDDWWQYYLWGALAFLVYAVIVIGLWELGKYLWHHVAWI